MKTSIILLTLDSIRGQFYDVSDSNPLVKMSEYSKEYRTLDCMQCFTAEGVMCHDESYSSMMKVTGSSNPAHGLCCIPGSTNPHCQNGNGHTCSQPVKSTDEKFKDILTQGLNYQMFAYCPGINQKSCGISDDASSENM